MSQNQYVQLDWSPVTWSLLLAGMIVFVTGTICLFIYQVHKAGQATAPRPPAVELPAHEEIEAADDSQTAITAA